ncbi:MAG TPA: adenylyl-sulfate kinase [Pseudolabrys sp.]|nr:adenylyl-sulfate kinase [Pseudolabrys sp.]
MRQTQSEAKETSGPGFLNDRPALRFFTCGAVGDGKSTLIRRMLDAPNLIVENHLTALEGDPDKPRTAGASIDDTPLRDRLEAEREQRTAIDITYHYYSTKCRAFVAADVPGDEQYTRNMAIGASNADLAIFFVDARKGLLARTRRDAVIASLMGIRHVVLAVNKIDLINFDEGIFSGIAEEFSEFASALHFKSLRIIPVSARFGDNVVSRLGRTPWYSGPTLFEYLETVDIDTKRIDQPFRFPVEGVSLAHSEFCGSMGTIASGRVKPGDDVVLLPSGQATRVKAVYGPAGSVDGAQASDAVTLTFVDPVDVARGDVIVASSDRAQVADQFSAHLVWMSADKLLPGRSYLIKINNNTLGATVTELKHRIDVGSLAKLATKTLSLSEIGVCNLSLARAVAFDSYSQNHDTGAFILVDRYSNETVAAGMIDFALRRASNIHHQKLTVSKTERSRLMHHGQAVLWFTGLPGAGKSTIANLVEAELHARGIHTALLDGDNIRHGLNRDLGFTEPDRVENIRRIGEVAKLMTEAGLVVLCSFISPFRAERRMVRELLDSGEFLEIFVDTPLSECQARDPKGLYRRALAGEIKNFTGVDQPYEIPENPELRLEAGRESAEKLAQRVVGELVRRLAI